MDRTIRNSLISLLAGGGISGGLYWLGGYLSLALVTGLCWACGLKLTFYVGHLYPAYATGETWADKRWTGLSVGLVTLAALVGVSPVLPLVNELRLGLGFLVTGVGLVAYAAGTLAVLERVAGNSTASSSHSGTPQPTDSD
ncbi:sterol desaturase [Halostagnicola sp. A-GB9-2]|uniref:sterol desaturase n=1 Tax=Halostagnicola sp. A-GB9-2 TaxID=3048066 RepID=UPI0024BF96AE|nr:sterol desaturase [Halostagnicola sp. A-GB9-2]MDJ1430599.1 sterol desaturase [Halostagnicola sp. A-GB9-2]